MKEVEEKTGAAERLLFRVAGGIMRGSIRTVPSDMRGEAVAMRESGSKQRREGP
jgi:hypothetical protein